MNNGFLAPKKFKMRPSKVSLTKGGGDNGGSRIQHEVSKPEHSKQSFCTGGGATYWVVGQVMLYFSVFFMQK